MGASNEAVTEALTEIAAARGEITAAFETILGVTETALSERSTHPEDASALETIMEASLQTIVLACMAEDIVGQRLTRADRLLRRAKEDDPFLRGPALAGQGLEQAAADALFAGDHALGHRA